jgi:hypothetical protein
MPISNKSEPFGRGPLAAVLSREIQPNPDDEKGWVPSVAPFQVDPEESITREILLGMRSYRDNVRPTVKSVGKKPGTFWMRNCLD